MARTPKRPCPPSRDITGARGRGRSLLPSVPVTQPGPTDGEHPVPKEEIEEVDNDTVDNAVVAAGDGNNPILVDAGDNEDGAVEVDATSTEAQGKRVSPIWVDFHQVYDANKVRIAAVCKRCGNRYTARSAAGTSHLK